MPDHASARFWTRVLFPVPGSPAIAINIHNSSQLWFDYFFQLYGDHCNVLAEWAVIQTVSCNVLCYWLSWLFLLRGAEVTTLRFSLPPYRFHHGCAPLRKTALSASIFCPPL